MVDTANILGLPDAGHALRRMAQAGIALPQLTETEVTRQAKGSLRTLKACMIDCTPAERKATPRKVAGLAARARRSGLKRC